MAWKEQNHIHLIDGNNAVFRGFYSTKILKSRKGFPTSAIKGFFNMLLADLAVIRPTNLMIAFDAPKSFRHKLYPEYKQNRQARKEDPKVKEELESIYKQLPVIKELLYYAGVKQVVKPGYEADDVIGTYANKMSEKGYYVSIASKDKDFAQLVTDKILLLNPSDRTLNGIDYVIKKFGIHPDKFIDFLVLVGDKSDNIPGVYKCGDKTAAKLLNTYNDLEGCIKNYKKFAPALKDNFKKAKKLFPLTKQLVTIDQNVPCSTSRERTKLGELRDEKALKKLFLELDMEMVYNQVMRSRLNKNASSSKRIK